MSSVGRHFIGKTILKKVVKSLCAKQRKDPNTFSQDKFSGHRVFHLTCRKIDHERNSGKYRKIFKIHRPTEMDEPESAFYFAIKH